MRRTTLKNLVAKLHSADKQLSHAIARQEKHETLARHAKDLGQRVPTKRDEAVIMRAVDAAHAAVSDALLALSGYIPRTPDELSQYVLTVLPHWRIKDPSFEDERDRECLCDVLASISTSASAIIFKQASAYFTERQR
jgi:hypothetical protein